MFICATYTNHIDTETSNRKGGNELRFFGRKKIHGKAVHVLDYSVIMAYGESTKNSMRS